MKQNPYQSPAPPREQPKSIWVKLWEFLTGTNFSPRAQFLSGDPVIYNGIIFHLKPDNDTQLFAACPTSDYSDDKTSLIEKEVEQAYNQFLAEIPTLEDALAARQLEIHLITSYREYETPIQRILPRNK